MQSCRWKKIHWCCQKEIQFLQAELQCLFFLASWLLLFRHLEIFTVLFFFTVLFLVLFFFVFYFVLLSIFLPIICSSSSISSISQSKLSGVFSFSFSLSKTVTYSVFLYFNRGSLTNSCCCCCCFVVVAVLVRCNFLNLYISWNFFDIPFLLLLIFSKTYLIVRLFFICYPKMFNMFFKFTEHYRELLIFFFLVFVTLFFLIVTDKCLFSV